MDEIDLKLIKILWEEPRCSYRDLADALGISTPAVHRRIQAARDTKILLGPFARLSPNFVQAVEVILFGRTEAGSLETARKELAKDDHTYIVTMMTGNVLLLRSLLKDISELDDYVNFVRKAASMTEIEIGIPPRKAEFKEIKLTKLDFKIMHALYKDGRKNVNEIADEIRVSSKTVRNHLKRLEDEKVLIFEIIGNQAHSGNFVPFLQINLDKKANKDDVILNFNRRHTPPLLECCPFSNHLHMFIAYAWLQNMAQLKDVVNALEAEEGVKSVVPYIFVNSCKLDTWLDSLLDDPEKAMKYLQDRKII